MPPVFDDVVRDHGEYLAACARAAARELGVFAALGGGRTLPELAATLGVKPRRLARLVDALVLDGQLARDGERIVVAMAAPAPAPATHAGSASTPAALAPPAAGGWGLLARVIREDRSLPPGDEAAYHDHLRVLAAAPGRELAVALAVRGARRWLLDAGAGAGGYAAAWLDADPAACVTLVDRAPVVALARAALAARAARVTFVEGDLDDAPLGAGHDAALLANVLHLHDPATCALLVARVAGAVRPGGLVVIVDLAIDAARTGPPQSVWFALNMALYSEGGDVHDDAALAGWLRGAGLVDIERIPLAAWPGGIALCGRRP